MGDLKWRSFAQIIGLRGRDTTPFETLAEMGYAGAMATVGCTVFSYPLGQMMEAIKVKRPRWEYKSMEFLRMGQNAAIIRLALDALLKKSLLLKVQVSLYAIHRAIALKLYPDKNPIFLLE